MIIEGGVDRTGGADLDTGSVLLHKSSIALAVTQRLIVESVVHADEAARVDAVYA